MKSILRLCLVPLLLFAAGLSAAERPNDADALKGVQTGKVVFDVNMADAKKMPLYLSVIRQTVDDLQRQGVEPDVILAFRGLSVRLISKDREQMELTDFPRVSLAHVDFPRIVLQPGGQRLRCRTPIAPAFGDRRTTRVKFNQQLGLLGWGP